MIHTYGQRKKAGESGISWTKKLLNTCMKQVKVPEDMANCPNVEEEGRCTKPREIPRHHTSKSHHEAAREDPGWEDPKESRASIGRRTTGIQKGQSDD